MPGDDPSFPKNRDSLAERVAGRTKLKGLLSIPAADVPPAMAEPAVPPPIAQVETRSESPLVTELAAQPIETVPEDSGKPILRVNFNRLQNSGFITPNAPRVGITEEFRVIKRQLLRMTFTDGHKNRTPHSNVIMVTSCLPGEGKTFIALNLAMSFAAERDLHVLLIDADSHRHSLSDLMGVEQKDGLVDLLANPQLSIPELLQRTNVSNLTFLSSGRDHPNSTEILASKRAGAMMQDFSVRYPDRVIIIDTPPVLASTEAAVLSAYVGQTILVVEKDTTGKKSLRRAIEMLEGCPSVSCVLNMASGESAYGAYTNYGY